MIDIFGYFRAGQQHEIQRQEEEKRRQQLQQFSAQAHAAVLGYVSCDKCNGTGHVHISKTENKK